MKEWLDQKQNFIEEKLNFLGLSLDKLNIRNLKPIKLNPDEVNSGMSKSYYGNFSDLNEIFNYVIVHEYRDDTRMVCLVNHGIYESRIKDVIDLFYYWFGLDKHLRGKMNRKDIVRVNENNDVLREWDFDDYNLRLKTDIFEGILMFWILTIKDFNK
jgi:hypothetical protein